MYGMMWYDNDPKKSLEGKIKDGFYYFEKKYGEGLLDKVFINIETPIDEGVSVGGLAIMHSKTVLRNHYYFVVKDEFDGMMLKGVEQ